jgi:RNA polymerase I-specific transcription initiation factor RRN7
LVICQEGHVLQGYREEEVQEDGDFVNVSSQKRYVRKGDRSKKRKLQKDVYGSERGNFLAYECLQLILRLQLKALRQEWPHLPPEIEAIARDLWTMFVSMVPSLKPTPYNENLDYVTGQIRTAREESRARSESRSRSRSRARSQGTGVSGSQAEEEEEEAEEERRLEAEIRRINGDRPQDTDEDIDTEAASEDSPRLSRPWARAGNEPMLVLAAIIYLALITARVPVFWGDLRCLFASNRVPFLSVVALLPSAMTAKLPEKELRRLERDSVPSISAFQLRTFRFAANLTDRFSQSIQFPELNAPSVLWRCVRDMGLPPTFYEVALGLLTYLGIPLAVVPAASVSDPWSLLGSFDKDPDEAKQPAFPPLPPRLNLYAQPPCATRCTIMMAAVVVAAKMRYGLDGMER